MPGPPIRVSAPSRSVSGLDHHKRCRPRPGQPQGFLLTGAVLAAFQQSLARTHRHAAFQRTQGGHRDVLKFQRHRVAGGQRVQPRRVGVGGVQMRGTQPCGGLAIRLQHGHAHAQRQGGQRQHLRQLPAAENAQMWCGGRHSAPALGWPSKNGSSSTACVCCWR